MKDLKLNEKKYLLVDPETLQYLQWQPYVVNYASKSFSLDGKDFVTPPQKTL